MEIGAEVILKGTKVDGVYNADPVKDPEAVKYDAISYMDVIQQNLRVMDSTSITLCMDNALPIIVFNIREPDAMQQLMGGKKIGTIVSNGTE